MTKLQQLQKKHLITTILKRFNIRMRCHQRNKKQPKEIYKHEKKLQK